MFSIVTINNVMHYERYFILNGNLSSDRLLPVINKGGKNIPEEYNSHISQILNESGTDDWILFCPDYIEILSAPEGWLTGLDPQHIWGVSAYRLVKNIRGNALCEHLGVLRYCDMEGNIYASGLECPVGTPVDALSFNTLLVHSSLIRKYALSFDTELSDGLFCEDFCLNAREKHQIESKIAEMPVFFYAPIESMDRSQQGKGAEHFRAKYAGRPAAAIADAKVPTISRKVPIAEKEPMYHYKAEKHYHNLPCVAALPFMRAKARILDVGCAYGDVGLFFQQELGASLWGMEYDQNSLAYAARRGIYQDLMQVDLDAFDIRSFSKYYQFFDQLFLGDVLEHLRNPLPALEKLQLLLDRKGSMLVSLPNVAHNYVIGNLLEGRFDYSDSGILDETHIRFFTWKSQAELFARAGLQVVNATVCFMGPYAALKWATPRTLPHSFYEYTNASKHFYVLQYVSELVPSDTPYDELLPLNMSLLQAAPENNKPGWQDLEGEFKLFKRELLAVRG